MNWGASRSASTSHSRISTHAFPLCYLQPQPLPQLFRRSLHFPILSFFACALSKPRVDPKSVESVGKGDCRKSTCREFANYIPLPASDYDDTSSKKLRYQQKTGILPPLVFWKVNSCFFPNWYWLFLASPHLPRVDKEVICGQLFIAAANHFWVTVFGIPQRGSIRQPFASLEPSDLFFIFFSVIEKRARVRTREVRLGVQSKQKFAVGSTTPR